MCERAKTGRKPSPPLTVTETGTIVLTVLLLICLALITTYIWCNWTVAGIISSGVDRLEKIRSIVEVLKSIWEANDDLPLSERARGYLENFAENHHRQVPFLSPEPRLRE